MLKKRRTFIIGLGPHYYVVQFWSSMLFNVQAKQVLQLGAQVPLDTIDISTSTGYGQTGNIFESLYRLGKKGKIEAGLAKSSQVSGWRFNVDFKIRKHSLVMVIQFGPCDFAYSGNGRLQRLNRLTRTYLVISNAPSDCVMAN